MQIVIWLATAWLASLVSLLELFDRASEMPDDQDSGRNASCVATSGGRGPREHVKRLLRPERSLNSVGNWPVRASVRIACPNGAPIHARCLPARQLCAPALGRPHPVPRHWPDCDRLRWGWAPIRPVASILMAKTPAATAAEKTRRSSPRWSKLL